MTDREIMLELEEVMHGAANVAGRVNRKLGAFALLGVAASASIAWLFYSVDSSLTWNIIKCGVVMLPAIFICITWQTLAKITDAPKQFSALTDNAGRVANLNVSGLKKPHSLGGLMSTMRTIYNDERLSGVAEVVGGIALLANPAFLFMTFISVAILLVLIIVAPLVFIF